MAPSAKTISVLVEQDPDGGGDGGGGDLAEQRLRVPGRGSSCMASPTLSLAGQAEETMAAESMNDGDGVMMILIVAWFIAGSTSEGMDSLVFLRRCGRSGRRCKGGKRKRSLASGNKYKSTNRQSTIEETA